MKFVGSLSKFNDKGEKERSVPKRRMSLLYNFYDLERPRETTSQDNGEDIRYRGKYPLRECYMRNGTLARRGKLSVHRS